ncbi:MAG: type II methionyl aminopeptidase [Halobacteriales archaeon]
MADVDLTGEEYEKCREAGEILATVLEEASDRIEVGANLLDVAAFAEERTRELGGEVAFPTNISVDEEASHATPGRDDDETFGEDLVCLDVGVHVDGYIADAATTVDLRGVPDLVEASEAALDAALDAVEAGVHTGEVGAAIEDAIDEYGYNPIVNLSGHGLAHYDAHTDPNIPNRAVSSGVELEAGMVLAIEPFATTGSGKVGEGAEEEIYELLDPKRVRNRRARQLQDTIEEDFGELPFAARWLDSRRAEMALQNLKQADALRGYPVLKESDGELVSQAEHTVIVTEDGCEITTA